MIPTQDEIQTIFTILPGEETSLRALEEMRLDLCSQLQDELRHDEVRISQPEKNRSIDPAIVGSLAVALSAVLLDKLIDAVVKWRESKENITVEIMMMVNGKELRIKYNPTHVSKADLKAWKEAAIKIAKNL